MANGRLVKVLAIDGGGIRGVIPAVLLDRLDQLAQAKLLNKNKAPQPIARLFDIVVGTSTGGIIATGIAAPKDGTPRAARMSPRDLVDLFTRRGQEVFPNSGSRLRRIRALFGPKYDAAPIERILTEYLGDTQLSQAITNLLVTSYNLETRDVKFFKCRRHVTPARAEDRDYLLRDVVRATSAAPTYFPPAYISAIGTSAKEELTDGGVYVNNPALCGYIEALKLYSRQGEKPDVLVVALGTGNARQSYPYGQVKGWGFLGWGNPRKGLPILSVMMDGQSEDVDYHLGYLLNAVGAPKRFYRFDTELPKYVSHELDDSTPANIAALEGLASELANTRAADLETVAELIT